MSNFNNGAADDFNDDLHGMVDKSDGEGRNFQDLMEVSSNDAEYEFKMSEDKEG